MASREDEGGCEKLKLTKCDTVFRNGSIIRQFYLCLKTNNVKIGKAKPITTFQHFCYFLVSWSFYLALNNQYQILNLLTG